MKLTQVVTLTVAASLVASTVFAQATAQTPPPAPSTTQQTPPDKPKDPTYEETVVVSASKTEQKIVDAPATMTVFTPKFLENSPAQNYGDILRAVPGVNVTQLSARDINVTSRAATSSLSTSQLALVDGRSLYQDFFGFVMWDFMPANMNEIKQIEVIRGPASAVWGANAMNGVINVITKSPREMRGASVNMGFGAFNREVTNNSTGLKGCTVAEAASGCTTTSGSQFYVNGTLADIINEQWSYKASVGYSMSDPFARPLGVIPGSTTAYPTFRNDGTKQPKVDLRLDRDASDGSRISFTGGTAGTTGIMESGIGPFQIESGTMMSYGKVAYTKGAFHAHAFMNALDGKAPNLLSVDATGTPVRLNFDTKTVDVEAGNSNVVGKNVFTYGGNVRFNNFHLTLAPGETSRTEAGGYIQDEIFLHDKARLVAGARIDKFSNISDPVFSPRVALVLKPAGDQTVRVSYNRAYRAPSMINNNLDVTIGSPIPLAALNPAVQAATKVPNLFPASAVYYVPTRATGSADLKEEHTDAFEVSYTGKLGRKVLFSAAWYYMKTSDEIFFTVGSTYTTPPAGWTSIPQWAAFGPLGPTVATGVWNSVQASQHFPDVFTYKNLGELKNKGIELGLDADFGRVSYYANYSYQADPIPTFPGLTAEQAKAEINLPAKNRFNAGITGTVSNVFGTVSTSMVDDAFWQDVLDSRYNGTTPSYTLVDVVAGVRLNKGNVVIQGRVNNLTNKAVQQHVFGDVMKRSFMMELKINATRK